MFDPKINGFPGLIEEHFYVTFGDPAQLHRFLRYRVEKTDTDKNHKNPTPPRNCRRRGNKSFFNVNANVLKLEPLLLPLPLLESYCKGKEKEDNLYSAIYYACIVSKRTWITQFSANYTMPAFPS